MAQHMLQFLIFKIILWITVPVMKKMYTFDFRIGTNPLNLKEREIIDY